MVSIKVKVKMIENKFSGRGVVYLSRVPPLMDSDIIRKMWSTRFEIERIFLEKEPEGAKKLRDRIRGSKSKTRFVEGWIEFAKKKEAKLAALALNNQLIGGKKRHNKFRDDRWNV